MRTSLTLPLVLAAATMGGVCRAQDGTFVNSGSGCPSLGGETGTVIYTLLPSGDWDLDGRCLTFIPTPTDWTLVPGGSWIAPTAAAMPVGPADDAVQTGFMLPFTFTYPGGAGTTNVIDIAPNGHVYLESGTITATRCCSGTAALTSFLGDTPSVAVIGADLDSTSGGQILFEATTVGTPPAQNQVAVITWDQVPEWTSGGGIGATTAQCQLWDDGRIVLCYQAMSGSLAVDDGLAGVSVGGGATDPGSISFAPEIDLRLIGGPNIGETVTVVAKDLPAGATLADLQFAAGQTQLPLNLIGTAMGCDLLVDPIFFSGAQTVNAGQASLTFTIPVTTAIGLAIELQALVADLTQAGAYPIPVFVSDRATMTIGMRTQPGDEPTGAVPILNGLTMGDTTGATTSAVTGSCTTIGADVWYTYTANCTNGVSGTATFTFCSNGASAAWDTVLACFSGTPGNLTQIFCNDDNCGTQSTLFFPVTHGQTYYIEVGGWLSAQGPYTIYVDCQ